MTLTRSHAATAAVAAAAALTASSITYAAVAAPRAQAALAALRQAPAPARLPFGGDTGNGDGHGGDKGNGGHRDHRDVDEGWVQINERSYYAHPGGCITVVSGLGAKSLNVRNDSRRTVEVFRGATCDNGAPIATVGPHSASTGLNPGRTRDVIVKNGVVGSIRIVGHRMGDF